MIDTTNSLTLSQFYPKDLLIQSVHTEENLMHITMRSQTQKCNCPKCNEESSI